MRDAMQSNSSEMVVSVERLTMHKEPLTVKEKCGAVHTVHDTVPAEHRKSMMILAPDELTHLVTMASHVDASTLRISPLAVVHAQERDVDESEVVLDDAEEIEVDVQHPPTALRRTTKKNLITKDEKKQKNAPPPCTHTEPVTDDRRHGGSQSERDETTTTGALKKRKKKTKNAPAPPRKPKKAPTAVAVLLASSTGELAPTSPASTTSTAKKEMVKVTKVTTTSTKTKTTTMKKKKKKTKKFKGSQKMKALMKSFEKSKGIATHSSNASDATSVEQRRTSSAPLALRKNKAKKTTKMPKSKTSAAAKPELLLVTTTTTTTTGAAAVKKTSLIISESSSATPSPPPGGAAAAKAANGGAAPAPPTKIALFAPLRPADALIAPKLLRTTSFKLKKAELSRPHEMVTFEQITTKKPSAPRKLRRIDSSLHADATPPPGPPPPPPPLMISSGASAKSKATLSVAEAVRMERLEWMTIKRHKVRGRLLRKFVVEAHAAAVATYKEGACLPNAGLSSSLF